MCSCEQPRPYTEASDTVIRQEQAEDHCLMDAFFREQQKLPPSMRSAGAMLVCRCKKCRRHMGTL